MNKKFFAKIDENDIIDDIIVVDSITGQDFINSLEGEYIEYFKDQTENIRGNPARKGDIYDRDNDKFYSKKPFPSFKLDKDWKWQPPKINPAKSDPQLFTEWNEEKQDWIIATNESNPKLIK